jgi:hypothetical protein
MMSQSKSALHNHEKHRAARTLLTTGLALSAMMASQAVAASSAFACGTSDYACQATYLCFWDQETNCWGRFAGTNYDWADYGWANRADWFYNLGTRCSARAFMDTGYRGEALVWLARGQYEWGSYVNDAESNEWYACK